jgi:hypothetical protein
LEKVGGSIKIRSNCSVLSRSQPRTLLRKGGTIMFSNNKRGFRMDHDGLAALGLKAQEFQIGHQANVIALDVESIFHSFGVGEGRRIDKDHVLE